jgi:hypothetical protein
VLDPILLAAGAAAALLVPGAGLPSGNSFSHPNSLSASRVDVRGARVALALEVQVLSLAEVLPGFDEDLDGRVSAERIAEDAARIGAYVAEHYRLHASFPASVAVGSGAQAVNVDMWTQLAPTGSAAVREAALREGLFGELEQYVRVDLVYEAPSTFDALSVEVDLFTDTSPEHRDLCVVVWNSVELAAFDLAGHERRVVSASAAALARGRAPFLRYLEQVTGARAPAAPSAARGVEAAPSDARGRRHFEWELLLLSALVALTARTSRAGLGAVAQVALAGVVGLVASRFVPVDPRVVRIATMAAPHSLAYLGCDGLLASTTRTRLMEATVFGALLGLALGLRYMPELAREAATEFQPTSDVPAALAGLSAGQVLLVCAGGLPGFAMRATPRARAAWGIALVALVVGGVIFARLTFA